MAAVSAEPNGQKHLPFYRGQSVDDKQRLTNPSCPVPLTCSVFLMTTSCLGGCGAPGSGRDREPPPPPPRQLPLHGQTRTHRSQATTQDGGRSPSDSFRCTAKHGHTASQAVTQYSEDREYTQNRQGRECTQDRAENTHRTCRAENAHRTCKAENTHMTGQRIHTGQGREYPQGGGGAYT